MRVKVTISVLLTTLLLAVLPGLVNAQGATFEWAAWNAQITAHANSSQLDIVETQQVNVTGGTLHAGERDYSQPVNIQNVSVTVNGQPQQLSQGTGAGQYQITTDANGNTVLNYNLPTPINAGSSFGVQIGYTTTEATAGVIDWAIVPGTHNVPINSSTATINFPDGQMPDPSLVRVVQGNGTATASGNSIVITAQGPIPANQPFEIQLPVNGAVNSGGNPLAPVPNPNPNPAPVNPVPANPAPGLDLSSIPMSLICVGACILGVLLMVFIFFGGSRLLGGGTGLPGALGGGGLGGGRFGGGSGGGGFFGGSGPAGGGSPQRGFRDSPNQNREVPRINNDKQSGGGGGFS